MVVCFCQNWYHESEAFSGYLAHQMEKAGQIRALIFELLDLAMPEARYAPWIPQ